MATTPICPNGFPLTDHKLLIAMHAYEGIEHINKFGSVVEAPADTATDIWDAGGTYTFPSIGSADMTHVSQTTDQVAARGASVVVQGLNTDWIEVEQTVLLGASDTTTPTELATPLMRVNRMWVVEDITLTSTVRLHNAAETTDYVDIQIDHNQTLNAIYTVPADKTAFVTGIHADYVPTATKNPDAVHFHMYSRRNAEVGGWRVVESFGIPAGAGNYIRELGVYIHLPEKTDIRLNCKPEAKAAHVHGSFDIVLMDIIGV